MILRSVLAVGSASLVIAGVVAVAPAPSAAAGSPTTSVTVVLKAPHNAALGRLARATGLSHRQRVARLARLVPSTATTDRVESTLRSSGLHVVDASAWTVTAAGPRSAVLAAHLPVASTVAATVPAALAPYANLVLPTVSTTPQFQHATAAPVTGATIRKAYAAKGVRPPGAKSTVAKGSTIATLQLSTYNSSDLTTYAKKTGLPQIVGTPRYQPVAVDGGASDSNGGAVEVDLDQESILSTAPSANQRPYFAPNSSAGYIDVFSHVFDDVVQNANAHDGGDPNIIALSTSWGGCESSFAGQIKATQVVIKALVAAGVTVFASSGDDGIYDCSDVTGTGLGNTAAGVDYPASSPQVVGVGGTNLQHKGKKAHANNGHNWREVAWSCADSAKCEGNGLLPILPAGTGGSGGGESGVPHRLVRASSFAGFKSPGYQRKYVRGSTFGHQKYRMVPDISAVGDPETGFRLYSSDPSVAKYVDSQGLVQVGGTSLSSPVSAALLTNALGGVGRSTGVGNIHKALYKAYRKAPHKVFRDVTSGTNGAPGDRGRDPSVVAHHGYDTVTGLGAVLWPSLMHYLHLKKHHHKAHHDRQH